MTEPRKQGYNPKQHSALPYVDKQYKELLDRVSDANDWSRKRTIEKAIEMIASTSGIVGKQ